MLLNFWHLGLHTFLFLLSTALWNCVTRVWLKFYHTIVTVFARLWWNFLWARALFTSCNSRWTNNHITDCYPTLQNGTTFSSLCSIYLTWDLSLVGLYHMRWKPGPSELKFPVFKIERIDVEFWSAENGFLNVGNYSVFGKTRKTQPVVLWSCVLCDKLIILCD